AGVRIVRNRTMPIFSTESQLHNIATYLGAYARIPHFQEDVVPGAILENIISIVRGGERLATYDYVDVVARGNVGWQVKSTKHTTPLTWKRAKIPNATALIQKSYDDPQSCQALGDAIIDFCNDHAIASLNRYSLTSIGYCR